MTVVYGNVTDADTYHLERGNVLWTGLVGIKNEALLRGSIAVDSRYRGGFGGQKTSKRLQDREWPRNYAFDEFDDPFPNDEIPIEVINATFEMGLRELISPGISQPDLNFSQYKKSVSIVGAVSVTYSDIASIESLKTTYTLIDDIIAPILTASGFNNSLTGSFARS